MAFELNDRLARDCAAVGDLMLCRVLLMRDSNYPWLILVPKRQNVSEIHELDTDDQEQLIWESSFVAEAVLAEFDGRKMNLAALGNAVAQLHIHHVVRRDDDPAWPNPVWGRVSPRPYSNTQLRDRIKRLQRCLQTSVFRPAELP